MSRSPSNFFRNNRNSGSYALPFSLHRRENPTYAALTPADPPFEPQRDGSLLRSQSTNRHPERTPSGVNTPVINRGMERLEKRRTMEERNFLQAKARSQNLNPPVDLRMLDYVIEYDDNLMCPICRCPFVDPVVLDECDHCFCRDCIRQTWTTTTNYNPLGPRGDCPTCRTPAKLGPRSSTSKILGNILDDLLVKCPKADDGCQAQVKRGEVQDHMSIYCGYAMIECPIEQCELPVQRQYSKQGCLHYGVSCLACREELQRCYLEAHWRSKCADRQTRCDQCKAKIYLKELSEHNTRLCPAISIPCPGTSLGCNTRSKGREAELHAISCTLAKLAPILAAQQQRLDDQEVAQKQMNRKLDVLEGGFERMHSILYPKAEDSDQTSAMPSQIPLIEHHGVQETALPADGESPPVIDPAELGLDAQGNALPSPVVQRRRTSEGARPILSRALPVITGPRSADLPEPFSPDFDLASPFPPPVTNGGPYASPLHHMLSMHESLRDEMSRLNSALQELDGRHSMQTLNENMRTREEITYMGAQVAGLSRQVHWLTSSQLQRQSQSSTPGAAGPSDVGTAGSSVEAAINNAVRGAARIVNAGREGMSVRRNTSEEGRTKL
ncbi:hypothetical protein DOTSEDRAFT_74483 [Dothistroma septosporum NZE10]|uniref:RING-type domain-containing protein n=1 Tax=Dothistroma septosporum (strain NZE10 / CBS 128990) TaxID=675120 RepID=N1PHB1_DOTSN|nr:hypothetical protein DOTSEDRAFT_74483 [Dothistroma septosporum NZE10]